MEENKSKQVTMIGYIITNVICIIAVCLQVFGNDLFHQTEILRIYHILCDAFVLPGTLCLLVAALIALSNEGSLDAIGYMLRRLGQSLIPFSKKNDERYADYIAKKKRIKGYSFITWTGLGYFTIGMIFLVLYLTV
ncbi:MAG: DUF3899 domain-containing protein [Erysipelotrichaceae bacterium]|nr:DUF3899 domain-containing protein [Erysipelotrichaceae bacterium]